MTSKSSSTIGFFIALIYGACSASMTFVNKLVLTSLNYNYPLFIVSCQMAFTIAILEMLRLSGNRFVIKFTIERAWKFLVPSIFYAANSVLSLSALNGMNIPMYGVIKRCAPVVILILGVVILKKPLPSPPTCAAVAMITAGCILAGFGDLTFDLMAYICGAASVFSQAMYLLLIQKHAPDFGAVESLHLNSLNTLPLLVAMSIATKEICPAVGELFGQLASLNIEFILSFTAMIVFGCLLNYLLFLCTTYNSALTTSITGTLKTLVQTVAGMFAFGGVAINAFLLSGIALNFSGGLLYTMIKHRAIEEKLLPDSKDEEAQIEIRDRNAKEML